MTKIHIDICIPFFTYNCEQRYNLTKKIFKHYYNLSNHFSKFANISFTLVGSEKILSQLLVNKSFKGCSYTYHEYEQGNVICIQIEKNFFQLFIEILKF